MAKTVALNIKLNLDGREDITIAASNLEEMKAAAKSLRKELEGAEFGTKNFNKLNSALNNLSETQRKIKRGAVDSGEAIDELTKKLAKEPKAIGYYQQLQNEVSKLTKQFKQLSKEDALGDAGNKLSASINEINTELKRLDASQGRFQRNVGNYPEQVTAVFNAVSPELGLLANSINGISGNLEKAGQIATTTGRVIAKAFIAFEVVNILLDGAQAIKAYTEEVNNLKVLLESISDASANSINNAVVNITAIGAVFKESTEDIALAANSVSQALSIPLEDAVSVIEQGFLAGANANNEFLDSLKEYPATLASVGVGVQELVDIQTLSVKTGIFSDKGIDAVKEFGERIGEQTKAARESLEAAFGEEFTNKLFNNLDKGAITVTDAMREVSKAMDDTQLPTKELTTLIANVFGEAGIVAGERFLRGLKDVGQGAIDLGDDISYLVRIQQEQLAAEKELARSKLDLAGSFAELTGTSADYGTVLQTYVLKAVNLLTNSLTGLKLLLISTGSFFAGFIEDIVNNPFDGNAFEAGFERSRKAVEDELEKMEKAKKDSERKSAAESDRIANELERKNKERSDAEIKRINEREEREKQAAKERKEREKLEGAADGSVKALRDELSKLRSELEKSSTNNIEKQLTLIVSKEKELEVLENRLKRVKKQISEGSGLTRELSPLGPTTDLDSSLDVLYKEATDVSERLTKESQERITKALFERYEEAAFESARKQAEESEAERLRLIDEAKKREEAVRLALIDIAGTASATYFDLREQAIQNALDSELEMINNRYDKEIEAAAGNAQLIEEIEKDRIEAIEKAELKAAKQRKKIAIKEATIAGALGLLQVFASKGTIFDKIIQAAIVTANTISQIALINAQEFSKGGVVRQEAGVVTRKPNAPRTKGGDNILAYLKQGERVLNAMQQRRAERLYGRDIWKRIMMPDEKTKSYSHLVSSNMSKITKIPTFAAGGQVTGGATDISVTSSFSNEQVAFQADVIAGAVSASVSSAVRKAIRESNEDARNEERFQKKTEQ